MSVNLCRKKNDQMSACIDKVSLSISRNGKFRGSKILGYITLGIMVLFTMIPMIAIIIKK